ncbi:MAG: helix-turn-helix domain-containing protein [Planctomycetota bacterium]
MPGRTTTPPLVRAVGHALRAERERRGWSQEELCSRSGLDRTYLSGIERGARSPTLRSLIRVVEALDIPLSKVVLAAESASPRSR